VFCLRGITLNSEQVQNAKTAVRALNELGDLRKAAASDMKNTRVQGQTTQKLWQEGNKSRLIQVGMALIAIPEPTPTTIIIGAGLVGAGAVQKGIRSRAIYMEDIGKTVRSTLKEIAEAKYKMRI
jgi:hypothetical protein